MAATAQSHASKAVERNVDMVNPQGDENQPSKNEAHPMSGAIRDVIAKKGKGRSNQYIAKKTENLRVSKDDLPNDIYLMKQPSL